MINAEIDLVSYPALAEGLLYIYIYLCVFVYVCVSLFLYVCVLKESSIE